MTPDYSHANADANIVYMPRDEWEAQARRMAELEAIVTEAHRERNAAQARAGAYLYRAEQAEAELERARVWERTATELGHERDELKTAIRDGFTQN